MRFLLIFVFALLNYTCTIASESWSFLQCAKYALENSLSLKDVQYGVKRQQLNYRNSFMDMLPNIYGGTEYFVNQGKTIDPNTNLIIDHEFFSNSYYVGGSVKIFDGFRTLNRVKFEKYNLQAVNEEYKQRENELVYRVMETYTQHLLYAGLRDIQEQQYEMSERELRRIEEFIKLGRAPGSDKYEAEARLAADEFLYTQYKNLADQFLLQLKKLMNFPADSELMLQSLINNSSSFNELAVDSVYDQAKVSLPGIQKLIGQLEAARKQLQITKGQMYPTLSLSSGWTTGYYETYMDDDGRTIAFKEQMEHNRRFYYGLTLNIPIFNGFQRRKNVQLAKVDEQRMENRLEKRLRDLEYEVNDALLSWNSSASEYNAAIKKENSRHIAFNKTEMQWEKGLISIMDFYESKNRLAEAKGEILRTRLQLFIEEKTIRFYLTGTFLE